jgi:hypothetical protein
VCTCGFHFALLAFIPALNGSDRITAKLYMWAYEIASI